YALGDALPFNRTDIPSALGPRSAVLEEESPNYHPWGVLFTVLGTVFLDFDADACQSPARAYLLDVTVPEDHAKGLSTFTVMAGLGGFMGYALGGINWDDTKLGDFFGGHVRAVFSLITVIFVACVSATVTSFKEIPLEELMEQDEFRKLAQNERIQESVDLADEADGVGLKSNVSYGAVNQTESTPTAIPATHGHLSVAHYLKSIVMMPASLRMVCLTNLFCWMAHVCYSLYFTDFAPVGSVSRKEYEAGVRFGCWGMAMYSLSCACYSTVIEKLIKRLGAKKVYVGGLCTYSCGMFMLFAVRAPAAVILFSWTAGVMYSTLFTMPYLLVAHYHATGTWDEAGNGCGSTRGIGTDVAVVSSCVFVAQLLVSLIMGFAVKAVGSTAAVVAVAA
ncbi:Uncharacterized protein OBRU01_09504, partial [Operophtera brumata]